ncbi:abortive infection protein [Planctomycetales bacterium]|nr:abortive infection protein [Planctomycetales bacterium]GHS96067.1 abortive infection protein [Planctomycetales bacterium]GHT04375.1 abortive infection protein [Planctomycetales bacterium]
MPLSRARFPIAIGSFCGLLAVNFVIALAWNDGLPAAASANTRAWFTGFSVVSQCLATLCLLRTIARRHAATLHSYLKAPPRREWLIAAGGLTVWLAIWALADYFCGREPPVWQTALFAEVSGGAKLWLTAAVVLFAPLNEELLFRGVLFCSLPPRRAVGRVGATLIFSAAVWTWCHPQYDWYFSAQIFTLGLWLGYVRRRTQSLAPGFALHVVNNFLAVLTA